jgi:hypothetical protein
MFKRTIFFRRSLFGFFFIKENRLKGGLSALNQFNLHFASN